MTTHWDELWAKRTGDTGPEKKALAEAGAAYAKAPGYDLAWRAARAAFWVCDRTEDQAVKLQFGEIGYGWAEKAVQHNPSGAEGHFYYGTCLGEYAKGMSIVKALAKGLAPKFEKAILKAIAIDDAIDYGGPHYAMGRYWFELPWPKYSFSKSEKEYLAGLKIAPEAERGWFYLAELYVKEKKWDKAKGALAKLAACKAYPDAKWEHEFYQAEGRKLVATIR